MTTQMSANVADNFQNFSHQPPSNSCGHFPKFISEHSFCLIQPPLISTYFLSPPGLSLGDELGRQPIGIVLTVLGVVVLDFSADATEGPIRAYLLDVADTEEQDMALNIHAASAGNSGIHLNKFDKDIR